VTRLIYFSRDYTTHDRRFLSALAGTPYETYYLRLERGKAQLEDRSLPAGVQKITFSGGESLYSLSKVPQLLIELRQMIREYKPDLIHAGPIQSCAFLVALAGFQPLVSMSWGYDLLLDADRSWFWRKATQFTLRRSKRLITDCQTVLNKADRLGMPKDRMVTFPWGVDLQKFTKGKYPPEDTSQFTIISTRSWEPIYGVDILAKAFVKAANRDKSLGLIMLGNGSQASLLRDIFDRGGVMERVLIPGQISQSDLPRYYQMADLYISASHIDGSSVSLMEALACGRPVLVSDIPGNREWVEPGINGWWFRDGDVDDLAEKILMAVKQRQELPTMSVAARQLAEERADWEQNFRVLLDTYEAVLSKT
jgi:glycosyltransferase involved in cell wall biosynthesis